MDAKGSGVVHPDVDDVTVVGAGAVVVVVVVVVVVPPSAGGNQPPLEHVPPPNEANGSAVVQLEVGAGAVIVAGIIADTVADGSLLAPAMLYARTRKLYVVPGTGLARVQVV
jgi:hypothetical protein